MSDFPIIIAGHSHSVVMGAPAKTGETINRVVPVDNDSRFLALVGPRTDAYWERLVELSVERRVALSWNGNQHMSAFLVLRPPHVDFVLHAQPDLEADVFVFTLGLTEAWASVIDGAIFPACPGTIAGTFDAARHTFINFTPAEIAPDLDAFVADVRAINPRLRLVLTVSPVPLVATATTQHVLCASTYSKAVLRVAAEETCRRHHGVTYFPAYEIVTGPQAPHGFFSADDRSVSREAIDTVMEAFLAHCETPPAAGEGDIDAPRAIHPPGEASRAMAQRPVAAHVLSRAFVEAECEEAMLDRTRAWG